MSGAPAAKKAKTDVRKLNAVLCGSGEYTTGYRGVTPLHPYSAVEPS